MNPVKLKIISGLRQKKQIGFTLIELLVVIAIISLLMTMGVVQLSDARAKSRDTRRLSDIRQLSIILEMEASENVDADVMVGANSAEADAIIKTCDGPGQIDQFYRFEDPSDGTADSPCVGGAAAICEYAISSADGTTGATVSDYQICFFLEKPAGSLAAGLNAMETSGIYGTCD